MAVQGLQPSVSPEAFDVRIEIASCAGSSSRVRLKRSAPRRAGTPRSTRFVCAVRASDPLKSRTENPGALLRTARNFPGAPGTGSSAFTWEEALPANVRERRLD